MRSDNTYTKSLDKHNDTTILDFKLFTLHSTAQKTNVDIDVLIHKYLCNSVKLIKNARFYQLHLMHAAQIRVG